MKKKIQLKKGKRIIDAFKGFMDLCKEDIDNIEEVYNEMKLNIEVFLENR